MDAQDYITGFADMTVKGKTISEHLVFESFPVWWFFSVRFERDILPTMFDSWKTINKKVKENVKPKTTIKQKLMPHLFALNDSLKFNKKKHPKETEILFCVHTTAISKEGKVDRIQNVIDCCKNPYRMVTADPLSKLFYKKFEGRKLSQYGTEIHRYMDTECKKKARSEALRINRKWKWVKRNIQKDKLFYYFEPALDFFFSKQMLNVLFRHYYAYDRLTKKIKALVMYENGGLIEKAAIAAAHNNNVPSFKIVHGIMLTNKRWDMPSTHYILTHGDIARKRQIEFGAPEENIIVTGAVFIEDFTKYKNKSDGSILFCTSTLIEENVMSKKRYFSYISRYFEELSGLKKKIKVKLHPREKYAQTYKELARPYGNIQIIEGGTGKKVIYDLISKSELVITFYSTIILEATLMNKQVVLNEMYPREIDFTGEFYDTSECIIKVSPDENMAKAVNEAVDLKTKRKKFIKDYVYKPDGNAPKRVINEIVKHIK